MHGDRLSGAGGQLGSAGNAAGCCCAEDSVAAAVTMTARARVTGWSCRNDMTGRGEVSSVGTTTITRDEVRLYETGRDQVATVVYTVDGCEKWGKKLVCLTRWMGRSI